MERVAIALSTPDQITRFDGLSLGESWAMVNDVRAYRDSDGPVRWLVKDNRGLISLPIWIDRKTGQGTFQRFDWSDDFQRDCLVEIPKSPIVEKKAKKTKRSIKKS